jgi:glucose/arabinose dehydrogenase
MDGRARACFIATAIALVALQSCGAGSGDGTAGSGASASRGGPSVGLKRIGTFEDPVYVDGAPGFPKLLFVVEQPGRVAVLSNGHRLGHPFLDISGRVSSGGERGLLSIAFPPDYPRSRRFYVYYTDRGGNIRVDEFKRRTPTRAAAGSRRTVIRIPHPGFSNHNGGQLRFLGNLLYFGTGDGGSGGDPPNNAQNRNVLLGKLLRIDPRPAHGRPYSIPSSNPFAGATPGRGEIYSYGLRNPFRFSFDRVTAGRPRIAIGDVGQNRFEELDYTTVGRAAGANFGWDAFEGFSIYRDENSGTPDPGGTEKPIFAYPHSRDGSCSIIGGVVVRDRRLGALYRHYVYADLCEGRLRGLVPHLHQASGDHLLGPAVSSPSSFGEDDRGRVYVASLEGPVYRLVPR